MSFLKTLFWIVAAVIVALFCFNNWTLVGVNLWNGMILETKLPLLLGFFFLLGLIPPLLLWQAARYRLKRQAHVNTGPVVAPPAPPPAPREPEPVLSVAPISPVPPGGA
jgi:membrane protein YdbS with pleckstrin-like domain